ncbi:LEAF RUST 10 DISEASE-RESISTANCE LOCUS RECEPTOR-LIKE PROTEIN KINASE-like 2.4 isoform X2 [Tripterygium wilfordii]|uniref:LEAF RUST 10 DISEASE-RESISTANCE LOCUS RECEPTOR-LIKE PROTEIN KINASE-like 2.4 isoform X2 n=1 Tax=Tripterygium wilfordii TaxID=458696 RepID=UPI0018F8610D|nr:LEAF RUST 10 DISEASE-RESISTANCE LOCUS RECEPTOR-LIKE PROTEIN KINASE-like 2.4 isoform X2 [Tripterygium wilfordii]
MSQEKLLLAGFFAFLAIHFHLSCGFNSDYEVKRIPYNCTQASSSCGNILNFSYPFRLKGDSPDCGDPNYELSCENNQTILGFDSQRYLVKEINYNNATIRIADGGIEDGDCSSRPINSLKSLYTKAYGRFGEYCLFPLYDFPPLYYDLFYVSCESPVKSSTYVDASSCVIQANSTNNTRRYHYVVVGNFKYTELKVSCAINFYRHIDYYTYISLEHNNNLSYMDIHKKLVYGTEISWHQIPCAVPTCKGEGLCRLENNTIIQSCRSGAYCPFKCGLRCEQLQKNFKHVASGSHIHRPPDIRAQASVLVTRTLFGFLCLSALVVSRWRKKHLSMDDTLEEFLQSQNNFMPIRYSYSQIRKMSGQFQDKLGEGGYGSVFKGKLRSGRLVAFKMLDKAKGNGQDFINEVATIGRIHHVNVVSLIGFCSEGTKRALVYDFMPNGSLDKYILSREGHISLSWKKMYEISLGIARGIEYLHRGCDMQILHFDIKPHNILLDENFVPKISDFGLAKLYSTDDSIVSVTAARGTIGYIAPELIYKRIGGVSYKADVYSFGMLLLEMLGKRKKPNAAIDNNSSQMYFPLWVYHEMVQGKITEVEHATEEEENMIKKMTVVGLWCIQIRPCDRPSMRKAIQMLEGHVENLELPPEPTFNIEQVPTENVEEATNPTWSSLTSVDTSKYVRLVIDAY